MKFSSTLIGLFAGAALSLATPTALSAQPTDPTNGGEGGKVIRVTTLAKDGPGSLAEALAGTGPRIIVFEVGGAIDLERSSLRIDQPYVTIAGQTAPSPGITLLRGGIDVATHDVKISHLRILTGVDGQAKRSGWEADAFSTIAAHDVVIENNTFMWAIDENMSASGPRFTGDTVADWRAGTSHDIVFRLNIAAEGLADASHPKGEHSKGSLIHDNATGIVFDRNIWAHNVERSPLVKGGAQVLMVNNFIYDPMHRAVHYNLMDLEWAGHEPVTGEITAVGNVNVVGIRQLFERWQTRDAETLQNHITQINHTIRNATLIPALKSIVASFYDTPDWRLVRPPLEALTDSDSENLLRGLAELYFKMGDLPSRVGFSIDNA